MSTTPLRWCRWRSARSALPAWSAAYPAGALGSGVGRRAAAAAPAAAELTAAEKAAPYAGAKYSQYAEAYPEAGPPALKQKTHFKTKEPLYDEAGNPLMYESKELTPEADAFAKERGKIQKQMEKEGYTPYFDPEQRYYVDPANYPPNTETINIEPKGAKLGKQQERVPEQLGAKETAKRLRDAYARGLELGNARDWYAMGQLEKTFVDELGPEAGREAFSNWATGMATTTAGNAPTPNMLTSHYLQYLRKTGQPYPTASHAIPTPVGGQYGMSNVEQFQRLPDFASLGEANPKRHNFAQNFFGNRNVSTIDEQMTGGITPGLTVPPESTYGLYERLVAQEAKRAGVQPANFQDVAWAGFKNTPGKPMISHVNDAIERTHRLTGMSRDEIVRRGIVRNEIPLYSIGAMPASPMSLVDLLYRGSAGSTRPSP